MKLIVALDKIPDSAEEVQNLLFGDVPLFVDYNCSCNYDPREKFEYNEDQEEFMNNLDVKESDDSFYGIAEADKIAAIAFEEIFKHKKTLTKKDMVSILKDVPFEGRPRYLDFPQKDVHGVVYSVKWHEYFKAENEALNGIIDKFMSENEGKFFMILDSGSLWIYSGSLDEKSIRERLTHIDIDKY